MLFFPCFFHLTNKLAEFPHIGLPSKQINERYSWPCSSSSFCPTFASQLSSSGDQSMLLVTWPHFSLFNPWESGICHLTSFLIEFSKCTNLSSLIYHPHCYSQNVLPKTETDNITPWLKTHQNLPIVCRMQSLHCGEVYLTLQVGTSEDFSRFLSANPLQFSHMENLSFYRLPKTSFTSGFWS